MTSSTAATDRPASPVGPRRVVDIEDAVRDAVRQARDLDIDADGDVVFAVSISSPSFSMTVGRVGQPGSRTYLPASLSGPDKDAIKIMRAIRKLDTAEGRARIRSLLGDIDGGILGPVARDPLIDAALSSPAGIVMTMGSLRRRPNVPEWGEGGGMPHPYKTENPTNQNATVLRIDEQGQLVHSFSHRRRGYEDGSYCPVQWLPTPEAAFHELAEYAVWHAALELLAIELDGELDTMGIVAPRAPRRPWIDPAEAVIVVLPDLTPMRPGPDKVQRPLMGPPLRTPPFGPVRILEPANEAA